jgi:hypothetical protein
MKMRNLLLCLVCWGIASCGIFKQKPSEQDITFKEDILAIIAAEERLQKASMEREEKVAQKNMDEETKQRMTGEISKIVSESEARSNKLESAAMTLDSLNTKSTIFNTKEIHIEKTKVVQEAQKVVESSRTAIVSAYREYEVVDELLENDLTEEFETAVFFPPGGYTIKAEDLPKAEAAFSGLSQRIYQFVDQFSDRKMVIKIKAIGYSDASPFSPKSKLYNELSKLLGANASRQDMNKMLSEWRAQEMGNILRKLLVRGRPQLADTHQYDLHIITNGRGEELPNPSITDYQEKDPRRRIVVIHWDVYPMLFN